MSQAAFFSALTRNPDILTCIANLSNDEVFTPPGIANQMLDVIEEAWARDHAGASIWSDASVTFIDPFTKSGVFLREITTRLVDGLADEFPDLEDRVDHILKKQVFGIGITHLTSLIARRSVYCSKSADGAHSITRHFGNSSGNIWFERLDHTWEASKCAFCGAPRDLFDRENGLETHAYPFIHTEDVQDFLSNIFGEPMHFDVVIGNPPYQMTGGAGGSSDSSIYQLFVEQALRLEPRMLSMVIPSRWLVGGRGMADFRTMMLESKNLKTLVDYPVSKEVFPGVEVKGGICYFLWSSKHDGDTEVTIVRGESAVSASRRLNEFDVFIRDPRAVAILRKVQARKEASVMEILTADTPFGLPTNFEAYHLKAASGDIAVYFVRKGKRGVGYVERSSITKNADLVDRWKVLVPKAGSDGGQKIPDSVLGKPWLCEPPAAATQSFLAFHLGSEAEARSLESYYRTRFFRFLVSLRKITQDALRPMYQWVPQQSWDKTWTDEELFRKYGLSDDECDYINSVIRLMDETNESS